LFYQSKVAIKKHNLFGKHVLIASPQTVSFRGEDLVPLPQAAEEAQEVAGLFPGSVYLRGKSANVYQLLQRLPNVSIFHFAGHALGLDHGGELLLSGTHSPNVLSAAQLTGLHLRHCKLVVLSACSTAIAERDITRNPDGLVSAFLASGAESVVASRWDVNSNATAELMRHFYQSMQAGNQATRALREARTYVHSLPAMRSPYYWAAFELFASID
jgi:CHAT domain-containing protein